MADSKPKNFCVIEWDPRVLTLDELAELVSFTADLHSNVAVPYVISELDQGSNVPAIAPPQVANVHMNSPLIIELLAGPNKFDICALGLVGYIIKNPGRLGDFLPRIREGRHEGRAREFEARKREAIAIDRYERTLERIRTRGGIGASGRSIDRFESEFYPRARRGREQEARNRRNRDGHDRGGRDPR